MNYINYINYISFIIMVTNNHFLKSKVKNSQRWYLLERTSVGFCDFDLHFVVVILHLLMFFIHIFFSTSSLTLSWTIARFLDPFCTFSPVHRRVIRNTFIFQLFRYLLTMSATVLSGHFLPTGVSYLILLSDILAQPAFIKVLLRAGSYFFESCSASYWSLKYRPDPSVCLIHSNPQPSIHVNIAKVLLVVKTLIRSAATLFSSHENIKQQPN